MDDLFVKEAHDTKVRIICSCCGHPFHINSSDKREPWCSPECRLRIVRSKAHKPKVREKSLKEMVNDYYNNEEQA